MKRLGAEGNDEITDIVRTAAGAVLIGYFKSEELIVDGSTIMNTTTNGMGDPFLILIDNDGKLQCAKESLGAEGDELGFGLAHGSDGLFAIFSFNSDLSVDGHTHSAEGLRDLLVTKTCLPCDTLTSITETTATEPGLLIYPNPASQSIRVEATGNSTQPTAITITDMLGHAVLQQQIGSNEQHIDISGLANGVYALTATLHNGEVLRQRLVVN